MVIIINETFCDLCILNKKIFIYNPKSNLRSCLLCQKSHLFSKFILENNYYNPYLHMIFKLYPIFQKNDVNDVLRSKFWVHMIKMGKGNNEMQYCQRRVYIDVGHKGHMPYFVRLCSVSQSLSRFQNHTKVYLTQLRLYCNSILEDIIINDIRGIYPCIDNYIGKEEAMVLKKNSRVQVNPLLLGVKLLQG